MVSLDDISALYIIDFCFQYAIAYNGLVYADKSQCQQKSIQTIVKVKFHNRSFEIVAIIYGYPV